MYKYPTMLISLCKVLCTQSTKHKTDGDKTWSVAPCLVTVQKALSQARAVSLYTETSPQFSRTHPLDSFRRWRLVLFLPFGPWRVRLRLPTAQATKRASSCAERPPQNLTI